jgi:hypothetical protein
LDDEALADAAGALTTGFEATADEATEVTTGLEAAALVETAFEVVTAVLVLGLATEVQGLAHLPPVYLEVVFGEAGLVFSPNWPISKILHKTCKFDIPC